MLRPFEALPGTSRIWIFPFKEAVIPSQALVEELNGMVEGWKAHGKDVPGGWKLLFHHFLIIAADESAVGVSGCSIDGLTRWVHAIAERHGLVISDTAEVWFELNGKVRSLPRQDFADFRAGADFSGDLPVFDNTVSALSQINSGEWCKPFSCSWHAQAFPGTIL